MAIGIVGGTAGYYIGASNKYLGVVNVAHEKVIGGRTFIYFEPEERILDDAVPFELYGTIIPTVAFIFARLLWIRPPV